MGLVIVPTLISHVQIVLATMIASWAASVMTFAGTTTIVAQTWMSFVQFSYVGRRSFTFRAQNLYKHNLRAKFSA